MKIKKLIAALLTAFIAAGCSAQPEPSVTESIGNISPSGTASVRNEPAQAAQNASAPSSQTISYGSPSLNGKTPDDVQHGYAEDSFGANLASYVTTGNILFAIGAVVPDNICRSGFSCSYSEFSDSTALILMVFDLRGSEPVYEYYNTISNKNIITDGSLSVTDFVPNKSASFGISMKFSYDGKNYEYSGSGSAPYTDAAAQQQQQSDQTCFYCSGSGRCNVCGGMGYTTWGGTRNNCSACHSLGSCYYCNGTGIQYYEVRGLRRQ